MHQVELRFTPRRPWAALRDVNGFDEQSIGGTHTREALDLLDRLLVEDPAFPLGPDKSAGLAAPDRDRLLAAVYARLYGDRIAGTVRCRACHRLFDLDFSLDRLLSHLQAEIPAGIERLPDGHYQLDDGCVFRLPNGSDECAVAGLDPQAAEAALFTRCVVEPGPRTDPAILAQAWAAAGPTLNLDLAAVCPECADAQSLHFDMQTYLLTALRQEQDALLRDVHQLATVYGWSLHEILGLPRHQRRTLANLIENGAR